MATIGSRVRNGTLKLGASPGVEFGPQASSVTLAADNTPVPGIESLAGTRSPSGMDTAFNMLLTAIQDWTDKAGLIQYSWDHNAEVVDYSWCPGDPLVEPTFTGTVTVGALNLGGDVGATLTSDATWPLTDKPVRTDPTLTQAA